VLSTAYLDGWPAGSVCLFTIEEFNMMFYKCITGNKALVLVVCPYKRENLYDVEGNTI
jgi:hypothetical protein